MYQAKTRGKACHQVFNPKMHRNASKRLQLEIDLRLALKREELSVYYQPIVALDTGALIGFEALVRWHHPERNFISPAEFIPIAEENGLILGSMLHFWTIYPYKSNASNQPGGHFICLPPIICKWMWWTVCPPSSPVLITTR